MMHEAPEQISRAAKWRGYAINLLLFVVLIAGVRAWQQRDMAGGTAPALHGALLDGQSYTLRATPGQPVLVHFWASWCGICRSEQSSIAAIARDNPHVITIAMQSGVPQEVQGYMQQQGIAFSVVNDPDGSIAKNWGVHAVPASFIIDGKGEIRFVEVGYTTEIGIRVRLWLAGLLG
jgi:thiol-disulfide isomerase/thioredoxin